MNYSFFENEIVKTTPKDQILILDLETIPPSERVEDLLKLPKQIVGIGCMYLTDEEPTLFVAEDEGKEYELAILRKFMILKLSMKK